MNSRPQIGQSRPQPTATQIESREPTLLEKEYALLGKARLEKVEIEMRIAAHRNNIVFLEDNPQSEHILKQILARELNGKAQAAHA